MVRTTKLNTAGTSLLAYEHMLLAGIVPGASLPGELLEPTVVAHFTVIDSRFPRLLPAAAGHLGEELGNVEHRHCHFEHPHAERASRASPSAPAVLVPTYAVR